jgi:pimeloyl-ACP methyl ester carboxylesterase
MTIGDNKVRKPLIVLHGLLGSKNNFKGICGHKKVLEMRDVYMLEMRNHAASDHHLDHNYNVMAEDVIRFAEKH